MSWVGRIIGVFLGWSIYGALGAVVGYFVGFYFDKARSQFRRDYSEENRKRVEQALFSSIFPLLGHMAKADGRVSSEEVTATEQMMSNMRLSTAQRQEAIALFKQGADPAFDLDVTLSGFLEVCGRYADIKQLTLVYLITLAMADGDLHAQEEAVLKDVAARLGFSSHAFAQILRMVKAQTRFYQGGGESYRAQSSPDELASAYDALGVAPSIADADLKKAYRRLMSQHHPDKLTGQGVPEDMVKVATERAQEIQTAYDLIKKHRQKS